MRYLFCSQAGISMTPITLKARLVFVTADVVDAKDADMYISEFNKTPNALAGINIEQEMYNNFVENWPQLVNLVDVCFENVYADSIVDPLRFERKIRIRYRPVITAKTPEIETYLKLSLDNYA